MKVGDLVFICPPRDITVGIFLGPVDGWKFLSGPNEEAHPLHRSKVMFDNYVYSVPTFQMEVISESR
jgi:hypothetical protein